MSLPIIPGASTVTTPAVPAIPAGSYSASALIGLSLSTPPQDKTLLNQVFSVEFCPMDPNQSPVAILRGQGPMPGPGQQQLLERVSGINVWAEATRSTTFATLMGAMLNYASLRLQEQRLTNQIATFQKVNADTTALQAELATVQTGLGVTA